MAQFQKTVQLKSKSFPLINLRTMRVISTSSGTWNCSHGYNFQRKFPFEHIFIRFDFFFFFSFGGWVGSKNLFSSVNSDVHNLRIETLNQQYQLVSVPNYSLFYFALPLGCNLWIWPSLLINFTGKSQDSSWECVQLWLPRYAVRGS